MAFRTNTELTMVSVTDSGTGNKGFMVDETFFLRAENELLDLLDNNGLLSQTLHEIDNLDSTKIGNYKFGYQKVAEELASHMLIIGTAVNDLANTYVKNTKDALILAGNINGNSESNIKNEWKRQEQELSGQFLYYEKTLLDERNKIMRQLNAKAKLQIKLDENDVLGERPIVEDQSELHDRLSEIDEQLEYIEYQKALYVLSGMVSPNFFGEKDSNYYMTIKLAYDEKLYNYQLKEVDKKINEILHNQEAEDEETLQKLQNYKEEIEKNLKLTIIQQADLVINYGASASRFSNGKGTLARLYADYIQETNGLNDLQVKMLKYQLVMEGKADAQAYGFESKEQCFKLYFNMLEAEVYASDDNIKTTKAARFVAYEDLSLEKEKKLQQIEYQKAIYVLGGQVDASVFGNKPKSYYIEIYFKQTEKQLKAQLNANGQNIDQKTKSQIEAQLEELEFQKAGLICAGEVDASAFGTKTAEEYQKFYFDTLKDKLAKQKIEISREMGAITKGRAREQLSPEERKKYDALHDQFNEIILNVQSIDKSLSFLELEKKRYERDHFWETHRTTNTTGYTPAIGEDPRRSPAGNQWMAQQMANNQKLQAEYNALEREIESMEKELGVYQNKWYDDLWESITQTATAWGNAFSSIGEDDFWENSWDALKKTGATLFVAGEKVVAGFYKVGEFIVDGAIFVVGGVCAAYQLLGDAIWGTSNAKMIFDGTLDIIRFDAVGAVEDLIYNNAVGEWINANSTIKIDSALADALKGAGVKITEIAAAAVLSYFTCGAAAVVLPMLFGFLEGVGESAENYAKTVNREDGAEYDYLKAVTKSLSGGISKAAQWYGYGKMGSTLINAASNLGKSAASMTLESAKNIITNSAGSYGKAFAKNLFEFGNFLEVASTVAPHVSALINGEESWKDFLIGCSVELGISTAMNLLSAGLAAKGDMKSLKQAQDYIVDNCFNDLDDAQTAIVRGLISGNDVDDNALKSLMCNLDDDQFRLLKELDGVDSKIGQMYDSYGSAFKAIDSASGLDDASRTQLKTLISGDSFSVDEYNNIIKKMDNKSAYAVRESLSPDQKQLLFDHKYEGAGRARAVFEKTIIGEDIGDRLKAFDGKLTDSLIVDGTAAKYYETQCYVKMDNAVYDAAKRDAVDGVKSFSYSLSGDSHILVEYVDWADGSTKTFKMPIEDLFGEYDKAIKNIDDDTLNLLIHGKDFSKMTGVPEDVIADALISGKSTQDMIDLLPDDYKQQWLKSMNTAVKVSDSGETANLICFIQESNLNKYSKGWQADPKTLVGYGNGSGQWCLSVDGLQQKIKDPNFVASLQRDLGLDLSKIDDWSEKDIQHLVEYIIAVPEGSMDGVRAITANMNITIDNITCNIAEGANSQYCFGGVTLGGIYECTTIDKIPCGVPKGGSDLISLIKSIGGY